MESVDHIGSQPYGNDPTYQVFRNVVTDFGADPTGQKDSTRMINSAIKAGNRCGPSCYGSSTKNAIVYFPPGRYLVSSSIIALYGTQLIGDAVDRPVIVASPKFVGSGVISTDVYTGQGIGIDGRDMEYYINTANFYRQIRNFVIDISQISWAADDTWGLHYQVSQATSLMNIQFICSKSSGTRQKAIFAENGSGGFMSDLTFDGGRYGIHGGNQQFTAHRLTFSNVQTAVWLIWDWGWTWKNIHIKGSFIGFDLTAEHSSASETGSVLIQDTIFEDTTYAIYHHPPKAAAGQNSTSITLDNVALIRVKNGIVDKDDVVWLDGRVTAIDTFILGPKYDGNLQRHYSLAEQFKTPRDQTLTMASQSVLPKPTFFERPRQQYEGLPSSQFVSVKKNGAQGDGITDDTAALQRIFKQYSRTDKVIYINAGSYIITDTIFIPSGAKIVGELWAQLVAKGPNFGSRSHPRPMLRVGNPQDLGSVEIQDLLFTSAGPTPGLIGVEWNIQADKQGSAALWDTHFRYGGAAGTQLSTANCPAQAERAVDCQAASLMMHITSDASGYFENMWLWVADHDLDDADLMNMNNTMPQLQVTVERGLLIQSQESTWLYGTAVEHAALYQYSFFEARLVHAGMIQTESPYYEPRPPPWDPYSYTPNVFLGDPDYSHCGLSSSSTGCDESWALRIERSNFISIAGAGLYSWFRNFDESCVDTRTCQRSLVEFKDNGQEIFIFNLITIGSEKMVTFADGLEIDAAENELSSGHPKWSHIAALLLPFINNTPSNVVFIDPKIWKESNPEIKCSPPCTLVLPPSILSTPITISPPPLVTSLEIGWMNGGTFTGSTVTTTLQVPVITTSAIQFSNILVYGRTNFNGYGPSRPSTSTSTTFVPQFSILPEPFIITDKYPPGISGTPPTRTITPPPVPFKSLQMSRVTLQPITTMVFDGQTIYIEPDRSPTIVKNGHTLTFGEYAVYSAGYGEPYPTTGPVEIAGGILQPPLPRFVQYPTRTIGFMATQISAPTTTAINGTIVPIVPCFAWFWFLCPPNIGAIILFGFELPGIYPPDGFPPLPPRPTPFPPGLDWPPMIPWPPITIGWDRNPTYRPMNPDESEPCHSTTQDVCSTTISRYPRTTQTVSSCSVVTGCTVKPSATSTTTSACHAPSGSIQARAWLNSSHDLSDLNDALKSPGEPGEPGESSKGAPRVKPSAAECEGSWIVIFPQNHAARAANDIIDGAIRALFSNTETQPIIYRSWAEKSEKWTFFWAIEKMTDHQMAQLLRALPPGYISSHYRPHGTAVARQRDPVNWRKPSGLEIGRTTAHDQPSSDFTALHHNQTASDDGDTFHAARDKATRSTEGALGQLAQTAIISESTSFQELALISVPPSRDAEGNPGPTDWTPWDKNDRNTATYHTDDSQGAGQTVYIIDYGWDRLHPELLGARIRPLYVGPIPYRSFDQIQDNPNKPGHGSCTIAKVVGKTLGLARKARIVMTTWDVENALDESWLDGLVKVFDDVMSQPAASRKKATLNLSLAKSMRREGAELAEWLKSQLERPGEEFWEKWFLKSNAEGFTEPVLRMMALIIRELLANGVTVVAGAGNERNKPLNGYPAKFAIDGERWGGGLDDMIVAGAVEPSGLWENGIGNGPIGVDIFAPATILQCPEAGTGEYRRAAGTSYAAPQVAALAAYIKTLGQKDFSSREIKAHLVGKFSRVMRKQNLELLEDWYRRTGVQRRLPKVIWNGYEPGKDIQVLTYPELELKPPLIPNPDLVLGSGPGSEDGPTLTFSSAAVPSPTCTARQCGTLCSASSPFCGGDAKNNSDFMDPLNPANPLGLFYTNTTSIQPAKSSPTLDWQYVEAQISAWPTYWTNSMPWPKSVATASPSVASTPSRKPWSFTVPVCQTAGVCPGGTLNLDWPDSPTPTSGNSATFVPYNPFTAPFPTLPPSVASSKPTPKVVGVGVKLALYYQAREIGHSRTKLLNSYIISEHMNNWQCQPTSGQQWRVESDGTSNLAIPPISSLGPISLLGDTCNYRETTSRDQIEVDREIGRLTCQKYADAKCLKVDKSVHCPLSGDYRVLVICGWTENFKAQQIGEHPSPDDRIFSILPFGAPNAAPLLEDSYLYELNDPI